MTRDAGTAARATGTEPEGGTNHHPTAPTDEHEIGTPQSSVDVPNAPLLAHSVASNADVPEPNFPPITTVMVGDITVHHRDSCPPDGAVGSSGSPRSSVDGDSSADRVSADEATPTFVLVHGLGGSMASWEPLWDFLAPHGRVLTPDLAGFGRTHSPLGQSAVGDNVRLLRDYVTVTRATKVVLVGNSMGGMIAAKLAHENPEAVDRLVLIDPVLPLHPNDRPHPMVLATFGLYLAAPLARVVIPRYVARQGLERMGIDGVVGVVADPRRVPRWVMRRAVEEARALAEIQGAVGSLVAAAQSLVIAAAGPGYRRALRGIGAPVTLLHGDHDHLVNVSGARRLARRLPNWRFVEGRGLGHVPMFEAAEWVAEVIRQA